MASAPKSEYLGFSVNAKFRVYSLRVSPTEGEARYYTLTISNRAFLEQRVRYQDAPEICFLRLERELKECSDSVPATNLRITDNDLKNYQESHIKKLSHHRPRPTLKP
jgi:hypothetical protein